MTTAEDRRLRALRSAKPAVDPWRPLDVQAETERTPEGRLERSLTIFLAGQECPFTCVFCDLWRYTTDTPTPPGAIPAQIRLALEGHAGRPDVAGPELAEPDVVKLYNASNFFDRAVPAKDDEVIATLLRGIRRVTVECHPRLVGRRCHRFAERLDGRLEVAMGFETAHPVALSRLNKRVDVEDLKAAAGRLRDYGVELRAFVLLGAPFVPAGEESRWLRHTVELALEAGARLVSLIPVRGGEGELARLEQLGEWAAPTLDQVEAGFEEARSLSVERIRLDTWDLDRLASDPGINGGDARRRIERLRRLQIDPAEAAA